MRRKPRTPVNGWVATLVFVCASVATGHTFREGGWAGVSSSQHVVCGGFRDALPQTLGDGTQDLGDEK